MLLNETFKNLEAIKNSMIAQERPALAFILKLANTTTNDALARWHNKYPDYRDCFWNH